MKIEEYIIKSLKAYLGMALFCFIIFSETIAEESHIQSWSILQNKLGDEFISQLLLGQEKAITNKEFGKLVEINDLSLFLEMAEQDKFPIVVAAGVACIQARKPELALRCVMKAIVQSDNPFNPAYEPLHAYLHSIRDTPENINTICDFLEWTQIKTAHLSTILRIIPRELLIVVWKQKSERNYSATTTALLLSSMISSRLESRLPKDPSLTKSISFLAHSPGMPRLIFLEECSADEPEFENILRNVLDSKDYTEDDVLGVIHAKWKFIMANKSRIIEKVSESRRALIEDIIKDESKRASNNSAK